MKELALIAFVVALAPSSALAEEEKSPHAAFELNPLALAIGRVSANIELVPWPHHGVIVTPYYLRPSPRISGPGGGFELGYRFFTGCSGPVGLYAGPSAFVQWGEDPRLLPERDHRAEGVAFDIGGQTLVGDWLVVGGGGGVEWIHADVKKAGPVGLRLLAAVGFVL